MSKAKFTKGAWEVINKCVHHGYYVIDENMGTVCDLYFMGNREVVDHGCDSGSNAHLIAAAPDMYAEIERDIEHLRIRARNAPCDLKLHLICEMDRKMNLLAKARGE